MKNLFLDTVKKIIDAAKRPDFLQESHPEAIKLLNKPYMLLVIETWEQEGRERVIAVAHYFLMNGDVIYDPEIVITATGKPIGITQCTPAGQVQKVIKTEQERKDARTFMQLWARNLLAQGWIEAARKSAELRG